MPLWSNTEANTSAPKYAVAGGLGVSANGDVLYANTTANAFVPGATIGVFAVSAAEKAGTGNVATLIITSAGSGFTARPTLSITGANTVQAVAIANAKTVGVTITAAGTGYLTGQVFTATGGTGTATTLTVSTVNANGNVTAVSITQAGDYTALPTLTNNPFTSNTTVAGVGFTATLSMGVGSTLVTTVGEQYNTSNVTVTVAGAGGTGAVVAATLTGQEGTTKGALAGWNLRKEGSGGRAGRVQYECLVAMGSMSGDGGDDSVLAP
jgi:hypothetical protein